MNGSWTQPDVRDEVVDYVRYWSDRTDIKATKMEPQEIEKREQALFSLYRPMSIGISTFRTLTFAAHFTICAVCWTALAVI